jgi:UDP-N-acetylglucosamine:LPS N-acetylglucosamine transferase
VSEAFMKGLPMLVYGSIPGQEESNTEFVVGQGAAVAVKTPAEASEALAELLSRPDRLAELGRAAGRLRRPDAARTVVAELARLAVRPHTRTVDGPAVASQVR